MEALLYRRFITVVSIIVLTSLCSACDMFSIPDTQSSTASNTPTPPTASLAPYEKPHQIALLLPGEGSPLSKAGNAIKAGFMADYQNDAQKPIIKIYDQHQYDKAVQDGANMIVGPLEKKEVEALEKRNDINVLTIALNQPDSNSSSSNLRLIEFSLSPTEEATIVADKMIADGHRLALLISPAGDWGQNISNAFRTRFQNQGGTVVDSLSVGNLSELNNQIKLLLKASSTSRRQDFDAIALIAQPAFARQIKPLLNFYHAQNSPTYSTSLVYSGLENPAKDESLNGIIFCDMPIVLDENSPWAATRFQMLSTQPYTVQQYIRLYGLGWDTAYLTKHFDQIQSGIYGAVGKISLAPGNNRIQRSLKFAVFKDGKPETLA